jgi:hypothetical protein
MPFDPVTPSRIVARAALYRAGRFFLDHPGCHCQGAAAVDARGLVTGVLDADAVSFCAAGRVMHELGIDDETHPHAMAAWVLLDAALGCKHPCGPSHLAVAHFNDRVFRKPREVGELLIRAATVEA